MKDFAFAKKLLRDFKYKLENKLPLSMKEIKQNENLMKEEMEIEYDMQKIAYEIKEKGDLFYNIFAMTMIFLLTSVIVAGGYFVYERYDMMRKKR